MSRLEGIRAVTYDCWGTLLRDSDWKGAMDLRVSALRRFLDLDEQEARDLINEAWARHDEAWKQVETFGPGRMAAYCLESRGVDDDDKINELTREFESAALQSGVEAVDGAKETLEALERAGIRRALVCDTGFTTGNGVRDLLRQVGLLDLLEAQCFSDEVGVPKPGSEIFQKALAELGVPPREAVHIGDLRRTDIAGARHIGMHAIRFRGVHDDKADATEAELVMDEHTQLLGFLGIT